MALAILQAVFLLLFALLSSSRAANYSPSSVSGPSATLSDGTTYAGIELPTFSQHFFGGVPYALPPVGDYRLRKPRAVTTSSSSGAKRAGQKNATKDAKAYGPICPGTGGDDVGYTLDEDCLTLNVIRPDNVKAGDNLPVMVWIYGGGFKMGGSADIRYNGSYIVHRASEAMKQPVLFVSFNYRVSAFGFLSGQQVEDEGVQNLGLWDQRLAMHWIKNNIQAFGGDPNKITIWGESAGAESIGIHLVAQDEKLFRAAIMESGNPTTLRYETPALYQPSYDLIAKNLSCPLSPSSASVSCLRKAPYSGFFAAAKANAKAYGDFYPVIDGQLIATYPSVLLSLGRYVKGVAVLAGANTDEGQAFGAHGVNTEQQLKDALHAASSGRAQNSTIDELVALYPDDPAQGCPFGTGDLPAASGGKLDKKSQAIFGDLTMIGTRRNMMQIMSKTQPCFSYRFDHLPFYQAPDVGVTHFVETPYVFDSPLTSAQTNNPRGDSPQDLYLAALMQSSWVSFANHLDPNLNGVDGAPHWPEYSQGGQNIVYRNSTEGGTFIEKDGFRAKGIDFINRVDVAMQFGR